jgi:hypothetical protein
MVKCINGCRQNVLEMVLGMVVWGERRPSGVSEATRTVPALS